MTDPARGGREPADVELSADELPAACPHAAMPLWSAHPRVFLDVVNEGEARCPYCGTRYRLRPGIRVHDHGCGMPNMHQHRDRYAVAPDAGARARHDHAAGTHTASASSRVEAFTTTFERITMWLRNGQR